jgi:hypothetical protein
MQKVEGSNPFSRFEKAFICGSFLCAQSARAFAFAGHPMGAPGGQRPTGATQNKPVCRHFLMTRTIDLLFIASASDAVAGAYACSLATPPLRPQQGLTRIRPE